MKIITHAIMVMLAALTSPGCKAMEIAIEQPMQQGKTANELRAEKELLRAIRHQERILVKTLLSSAVNPRTTTADNETVLHLAAPGHDHAITRCLIDCLLFKIPNAKKQSSRKRLITALCCIRCFFPQEILHKIVGESEKLLKDLWNVHGLKIGLATAPLSKSTLLKGVKQLCILQLVKHFSKADRLGRMPSQVPDCDLGRRGFRNNRALLDPASVAQNWGEALENHIRTHLELPADKIDQRAAFTEPGEWCSHLHWAHLVDDAWQEWQDAPEIRWW